jgi:Helix-turn-helix domain
VKALAVLEVLLWAFHNAKSGLCFPSYEKIAEAAGCARSPIARALKSLESCGILSWVHRLKRVREPCPDLLGDNSWRWRLLRTSNAYDFRDPGAPNSSKANFQSGTLNQAFFSSLRGRLQRQKDDAYGVERSFAREG